MQKAFERSFHVSFDTRFRMTATYSCDGGSLVCDAPRPGRDETSDEVEVVGMPCHYLLCYGWRGDVTYAKRTASYAWDSASGTPWFLEASGLSLVLLRVAPPLQVECDVSLLYLRHVTVLTDQKVETLVWERRNSVLGTCVLD